MRLFVSFRSTCTMGCVVLFCILSQVSAVDVFFDSGVPGSQFAAQEIGAALESNGQTVSYRSLGDLDDASAPTRFILALSSSSTAVNRFSSEGGGSLPSLSEQSFAVRRTSSGGSTACWAFGGDNRGVLYGALDMAETIRMESDAAISSREASPRILNRGIKFNIPLDARTPSYSDAGTAAWKNVAHMWDIEFWHDFLDELARGRYNLVSLWSLHPFPSLVKVPEYPNVALNDVMAHTGVFKDATLTGTSMYPWEVSSNLVTVKTMTIEEKMAFWQDVMAYGKQRGIDFYIFTWNIFTYGADGKDGVTSDPSSTTKDYYRKSIRTTVQTYPDLAGFGITAGENMQGQGESWLYDVYGQGIMDGKQPGRSIRLIHRQHQTSMGDIANSFSGYDDVFDFSYKYSKAHMYSSASPTYMSDGGYLNELPGSAKMWLTLRNDDVYMMRWGGPDFARAYLGNIPMSTGKIAGFYMGPDGYTWGREVISTEPESPRQPVAVKQWYSFRLWGKLAYDITTPDSYFEKLLGSRFPTADASDLFTAWASVSNALPLVTRFHWTGQELDYHWYPEACYSDPTDGWNHNWGFHDIQIFIDRNPHGPNMMNIPTYKDRVVYNQSMGNDTTPAQVGDMLLGYGATARPLIDKINPGSDKELRLTLGDIRAMSYLSTYYGEKILGAGDKAIADANGSSETRQSSVSHMENAARAWRTYATIIGTSYEPVYMTRMGSALVDVRSLIMPEVIQDIQRAGGSAVMPSMDPTEGGTVVEAEDAQITSGGTGSSVSGFTGSGYVDFGSATDGAITWTFDAPSAGRYLLEVRYSLATGNASVNLDVGGTAVVPALSCWPTGNASSWVWDQRLVNLPAGSSTITLTAGANAPLIDHLNMVRVGSFATASTLTVGSRQPRISLHGNRFSVRGERLGGQAVKVRTFAMDGSLVYSRTFHVGEQSCIQGELLPQEYATGGYVSEVTVGKYKQTAKIVLTNRR